MDVYEVLFIAQLFLVLGITGAQLVNVLSMGQLFNAKLGTVLFGGFWVFWLLGLMVMLTRTDELIFSVVLRFENLLILMNFILWIAEIFFAWGQPAGSMQAYRSGDTRR